MTLADLIPSLRGMLQARLEPGVWPGRARATETGQLLLGEVPVTELAARYGTPLRVLDEAEVRQRCRAYRAALPDAEIAYASATNASPSVLSWVREEGLSVGVCSRQTITAARSVGFAGCRVLAHGCSPTVAELQAALDYGVGRIVLRSVADVERLGALAGRCQPVLVGLATETTRAGRSATGATHDAAVGPPITDGAVAEVVRRVLARPRLRLVGLHCHLGSSITRIGGYEAAARRVIQLMATIRELHGITAPQLDLSGDHGLGFDLQGFATRLRATVHRECGTRRIPLCEVVVEPGRAVVNTAGLTLYRVTAATAGPRLRIVLDGRPPHVTSAGAPPLRLIGRVATGPLRPADIVDAPAARPAVSVPDLMLPADMRAGDLVVVPGTGASHRADTGAPVAGTLHRTLRAGPGAARLLVWREPADRRHQ